MKLGPQQMKTFAQPYDATPPLLPRIASQDEIVKHGLELQAKFNTMCAFEHLIFRGIDIDIVAAVLFPSIGANSNICH